MPHAAQLIFDRRLYYTERLGISWTPWRDTTILITLIKFETDLKMCIQVGRYGVKQKAASFFRSEMHLAIIVNLFLFIITNLIGNTVGLTVLINFQYVYNATFKKQWN